MRESPTRAWRGVSAEERNAERRGRLIEAGIQVIGTEGWAKATVRRVCDEAGLTVRYFYENFEDADALLIAVFDHVVAEGTAAVVAAFLGAEDSPRRRARAAVTAGFTILTEDPRRGRILLNEGSGNAALEVRRHAFTNEAATLLAQIATEHAGTDAFDPSDVRLTALAIVGAEFQLATSYLAGELDVPLERVIEHVTELHLAAARVTSAR